MTNELTAHQEFAKQLAEGIAESRASTILSGGGTPLLRLLKRGNWVFGMENEEVQGGSRWIVNIMSLAHGWCCWVETSGNDKNKLKGEVMVSITKPKPAMPPPIDNTPYKEQRAFNLKCYDGEDAGAEVAYKTNSDGGMKAFDKLILAIQQRLVADPLHCCPVLVFGAESYDHPKWGETWKPIFDIVDWSDMNGNLAGQPAQVAAAKPAEPPPAARPRKAAIAPEAATAAPEPAPAPAPAAPAPGGAMRQRTRKAPVEAAPAPAPALAPAASAIAAAAYQGQRRRPVAR
jgi:hypothetical protein